MCRKRTRFCGSIFGRQKIKSHISSMSCKLLEFALVRRQEDLKRLERGFPAETHQLIIRENIDLRRRIEQSILEI
jgi:phage terminase small subunit